MGEYPIPGEEKPAKHSGVGIASFVLAMLSMVGFMGLMVMAVLMELGSPGSLEGESPALVLLGLGVLLCMLLIIVGIVLGIVGLLMPGYRRLYSGLGLGLNCLWLLLLFGLMLLGSL